MTLSPSSSSVVDSPSSQTIDRRIEEQIRTLSIPDSEITPAVRFAMSALIERLDDATQEVDVMRGKLAEMSEMVDVDYLAPIANRRAFMRRLSWAIAMFERHGHPTAILYIDLNDFKSINDVYGHAAGDSAIRHVATVLSETMRESDFIARLGGDEFAVIMYHAEESAAAKRGKKIIATLEKTPFLHEGNALHISAAYGCHAISKGDTADSALAKADRAMYADKQSLKRKTKVD